jgi:hypothetical protein
LVSETALGTVLAARSPPALVAVLVTASAF